jgi:hypothetical protein
MMMMRFTFCMYLEEGGMVEWLNGIVAYVYSRFGRLGWMVFKD